MVNQSHLNTYKATGRLPQGYATHFIIIADDLPSASDKVTKWHFSMITEEQHQRLSFSPVFAFERQPNDKLFASGIMGTIETVNGIEQVTSYQVTESSVCKGYAKNAKADLVNFANLMEIGITNKAMLHLEAGLTSYTPVENTDIEMEM